MKLGVAAVLKELAKEKKKSRLPLYTRECTNRCDERTKDFRGSKDCFLLGKEETKEDFMEETAFELSLTG